MASDMKAKYLIIVSVLLALLLFASYYFSVNPSDGEIDQPLIEPQPEPKPDPVIQEIEPEQNKTPENITEEPEDDFNEVVVEIVNFKFIPQEITIPVGTTVVWKNLDIYLGDVRPHVIAAHQNEFRSGRLLINDTFYHTFTKIGNFTYIDAIFTKQMQRGRVNVVADKKDMGIVTGNVIGFNRDTTASALIILLLALIVIGLYSERKIEFIIKKHHKK